MPPCRRFDVADLEESVRIKLTRFGQKNAPNALEYLRHHTEEPFGCALRHLLQCTFVIVVDIAKLVTSKLKSFVLVRVPTPELLNSKMHLLGRWKGLVSAKDMVTGSRRYTPVAARASSGMVIIFVPSWSGKLSTSRFAVEVFEE